VNRSWRTCSRLTVLSASMRSNRGAPRAETPAAGFFNSVRAVADGEFASKIASNLASAYRMPGRLGKPVPSGRTLEVCQAVNRPPLLGLRGTAFRRRP